MASFMHSFFAEASAKGAKSTALHSLQWLMAMLLVSLPVCVFVNTPEWLLYLVTGALGLVLLVFLIAYIFLLFTDRDSLRSETYTLSKMAIERGLVGDNLTGLHNPEIHDDANSGTKGITVDQENEK